MDDERRDIIMEEVNDSLKEISYQAGKIAEMLEKPASCVSEEGKLSVSEREYKYK